MTRFPLSAADQARISEAVRAAERATDGEIVPVIAARSDSYADAVLHSAVLASLAGICCAVAWPAMLATPAAWLAGGWPDGPASGLSLLPMVAAALFLLVRFAVGASPLRYRLTPSATRTRRVRRRALDLFRIGVAGHTAARNGVLIYLSLAERRAEIVADAAVHALVPPERWGEIVADLTAEVADHRIADGMAGAVAAVGVLLAAGLPRTNRDPPELPDRLIQL